MSLLEHLGVGFFGGVVVVDELGEVGRHGEGGYTSDELEV